MTSQEPGASSSSITSWGGGHIGDLDAIEVVAEASEGLEAGTPPVQQLHPGLRCSMQPMGWAIDLDGVVWLGDEPIDGAAKAVCRLRDAGEQLRSSPTTPTDLGRGGVPRLRHRPPTMW
jgi:hypothetical protein